MKAHLKLRLGRNIEGNKKTFTVTSSSKRLNKENVGLLLYRVVATDTDDVLNAFFAWASIRRSPRPLCLGVGFRKTYLWHMRIESGIIFKNWTHTCLWNWMDYIQGWWETRLLPIIFENFRRLGEVPENCRKMGVARVLKKGPNG